ncbi:MAG: diaminopimelate decarboxylase [Acidobacteriota bacterium]|jgi:diaminopimelate decarboxylase
MRVEGVELAELAERIGTPFYCYSAATIARALGRWRDAFAARGFAASRHRTCFAVKANSALAVLRHLTLAGSDFDVVSAGELYRVAAAGGRVESAVFAGPGKTDEDLRYAVDVGVGIINVEVPGEIERLQRLAEERDATVEVGLRLNPDLDPKTHPAISTGPRQTKFGLAPDEIEALIAQHAFDGGVSVVAVAVHIGSQIVDLEPLGAAARQALEWAGRLRDAGQPVQWIDVGGGLAIPYDGADEVPTPEELAAVIGEVLAGWDGGLITEPGRILVGPAGWLVTRVTAARRRGEQGLLVCDAGMNALLRPALYGARHAVRVIGGDGAEEIWDVMGPLCEAGDVLARSARLQGAAVGSLLAVCDTGAYGFVMSSEYNAHPRPPQIWIDGNRWSTITPRRTYDEMLDGECLAPWQPPVPDPAGA